MNTNNESNTDQIATTTTTGAATSGVGMGGFMGPQWRAMMAIQHQMMMQHYALPPPPPPPQHYMYHPQAYLHHHHPPPPSPFRGGRGGGGGKMRASEAAAGENRTIWVGDLQHWMDENYLHRCFAPTREIASIKVIRNKHTGVPEGYGFVEFHTHAMAEKVLQDFTGVTMLHTFDQPFRLNWATFSTGDKRSENGTDLSIFVGDLAPDVTDSLLHETFASKYASVKAAKVVIDGNSGRSKGYGFVRFGDENEKAQAMNEMNGVYCSSRAMRIGAATPRKSAGHHQGGHASNGASSHNPHSDADSTYTTIFVGGLDPNVTDAELRQSFSQYGEIVSVKIPSGKGCGFVQFANRSNAEEALDKLNGTVIGAQTVRLSWGRNPANKQGKGDFSNQWNGAFYGSHLYDGYDYMMRPFHDPSMYAAMAAAAYSPYPIYGNGSNGNQQEEYVGRESLLKVEWKRRNFDNCEAMFLF
ncbi:Polyadenylate-binding protein RBP47C-like protein [Drosera capensis]